MIRKFKSLINEIKEIDWLETIKTVNLSPRGKIITIGLPLSIILIVTYVVTNVTIEDSFKVNEIVNNEGDIPTINFTTSNGKTIDELSLTELSEELNSQHTKETIEIDKNEIHFNENRSDIFINKEEKRISIVVDDEKDLDNISRVLSSFSENSVELNAKKGDVIELLIK